MATLRIGDLARLGAVSVRMLRHYHEIGLLVPAEIDDRNGYRGYDAAQLDDLRRIAMLRAVGVPLADIARLGEAADVATTLAEILRTRRTAVLAELAESNATLDAIDHHLTELETPTVTTPEPTTPTEAPVLEVEMKHVPARLVAQLSAVAESWAPTDIGPVIQPLYPELISRMERAGVAITGPSTAWYEDTDEGRVLVHATLTIDERPDDADELDFEIIELPAIELAATTIHTGTMDNCDQTYEAMLRWLDEHGHRPVGYSRELDIECGPDREWITELQFALET